MANKDFDFEIDFEDFSDEEIDIDLDFETRYIKPPLSVEIPEHNLKYANAEKLAQDLEMERGGRYYVVVNGSFIFGDFIEALLVEKQYRVKKMTISTLSMSENNVDSLANLCNAGYIDKLDLIVSDYFFSHERQNLIPYLYKRLDHKNRFQLAAAGTHCKLCIFQTYCGRHIVIHGSANLRSSSNIEQIVIEDSKTLYDFNDEYQSRITETYKTINKSIRGKKLWQAVQESGSTSTNTEKC